MVGAALATTGVAAERDATGASLSPKRPRAAEAPDTANDTRALGPAGSPAPPPPEVDRSVDFSVGDPRCSEEVTDSRGAVSVVSKAMARSLVQISAADLNHRQRDENSRKLE
jgi:hypothetical protein